jgi:hypothetical protein|tara:strand:- start:154 stop:513 length:360 start_codon:yes stop_codon:yes gene_type:complete
MKTPIIKYNDGFLDGVSWFMKVGGITIYPFVILREKYKTKKARRLINHESIHIKQQEELLVIPFYVLYVTEFLIKSIIYRSFKKAYYNLSFEREAYDNERKSKYISRRKSYACFSRIIR